MTQDQEFSDVGDFGLDWSEAPIPLASPFRALCAIRQDLPSGPQHCGTGAVVGAKVIITAAHVVDQGQPREDRGGYWRLHPARFFAVRGLNRESSLATQWIKHIALPVEYAHLGADTDIAVLITANAIGPASDAIAPSLFNASGERPMSIAGYPQHEDDRIADGNTIKIGTGPGWISPANNRQLNYVADTYGGHSGAPVFLRGTGGLKYIGVHKDESHDDFNIGLRFRPDTIQWVQNVVSSLQ